MWESEVKIRGQIIQFYKFAFISANDYWYEATESKPQR